MIRIIALFLYFLHPISCDWVSEWMSPIQEQLKEKPAQRTKQNFGPSLFGDDSLKLMMELTDPALRQGLKRYSQPSASMELSAATLSSKLESTLMNSRILAEMLKQEIREVSARETVLKDAIVNGRSGVSSVVVTLIDQPSRAYIIRDGVWARCRGMVVASNASPSTNGYSELVGGPKCLGQEMLSEQDPCAFNSVVKYETVPTVRRLEYAEDDFLCLKQTFNNTLERYLSVPRKVVNETCQNGIVRSLEDNNEKCGLRVMSEYTYYPSGYGGRTLPLEYCKESNGACKLIMAWHVSNATIENFEFLKNEQGFKKYFIESEEYLDRLF